MKSNLKMLIGAAAALVLLSGVTAALLLFKPVDTNEGEEVSETTAVVNESRLLYEKAQSDIESIDITNETGTFRIKKFADDAWFVEEFAGFTHDTSAVSSLLGQSCTLTAAKNIGSYVSDLSVYGLDKPRAQVNITFGDGTVKDVAVGSDAPADDLVYVMQSGNVYAVNKDSVTAFLQDKFYFLSKTVYMPKMPESENDTTDYKKINSITIKRPDLDYDNVLEYDPRQDIDELVTGSQCSHIMTQPVRLDLHPDNAYPLLNNVFGLTAKNIAVVAPSQDTLDKLGFNDPIAVVDFDIVGGDLHFVVGSEADDGYYCMAEGIDIVFIFDKDTVPWATVKPEDIAMTLITSTYIYTIKTIDVAVGEDDITHFELNGDKDDFHVTYTRPHAGKTEKTEADPDLFRSFYQYFLKAPAEEIYLDECTDPAKVSVTITSEYGTDKVEFIPSSNRLSIIRLNGRTSFRCRTVYADRLIDNLENLLDGKDIITTW